MARRKQQSKTQRLINSIRRGDEQRTAIATEMYLPNHSGDHSAGRVNTTPTSDFEIVNKKYVDDNIHDAVTVTDGTTINFTLTTQDITAETIDTAIDHDALLNFLTNEHIDWTLASQGTIHTSNYVDNDTTYLGGTGITLTGTTFSTTDGEIVHDNLSGFVLAEHIDWSLASQGTIHASNYVDNNTQYTAGNGLQLQTTVFSTEDSEINHDALLNFVANEHIDHTSVTLTAGTGLTGGGDISANRTFDVSLSTSDIPVIDSCEVTDASDQTISNATNTVVDFDSENWDTNTMHDTTTNNPRITIKTAGKYLIAAAITFDNNATGYRQMILRVNGTTSETIDRRQNTGSTDDTVHTISTVMELAVDDYIELLVRQTSGGDLIIRKFGSFSPKLSVTWLGA